MLPFLIRLAELKDIPLLEDVERSAAIAFLALPDYTPSNRTVSPEFLKDMATEKKLWVATINADKPIGFVGYRDLGNIAYVHEISVAHEFQKQGVGRRLMLSVMDAATSKGYAAIGLTTRRDAVWNMPFYKTLGFCEMVDVQECPALWDQLQDEINAGANPSTRCAMIKRLAAHCVPTSNREV